MTLAYNPANLFAVKVWEVELRKTAKRTLIARIYQPQGNGPFPVLLDLHGGAWSSKDRYANEPMARAIAESGMLVVSPDLRLSEEAPYPACVQDASHALRWLKHKARELNGDPTNFGLLGSSSGGHVAQLLGMRPRDTRYNEIPLAEAPKLDASVAYVATLRPELSRAAEAKGIVRRADKIVLPRSASAELEQQHASKNGQMFFELSTPTGRVTHA